MRIGVLGPLEIDERTARLGSRDRVVLSALAMSPGRLFSPEELADAVWADDLPASWSKNLQGCISRLRKRLGSDSIETSPQGYTLRLPTDAVDTTEFTRLARRARELMTLHECEHARYVAAQALDIWRGRPLPELDGWDAARAEAGRLSELRWELEEIVVEASLAAGHHREVLAQAAAMVEAAPLRESRWSLLARAQYQSGQQTEALRTLRRVRVILQRELGLDPSPDLVALEQAILRQDADLMVVAAPEAREHVSPYQGLAAYGEADAESFFGRDEEIRTCVDRLRTVNLLAIVGPSGSGKSSLLRAGLAAALHRDGARVLVISPGAHPVDALVSARPRATTVILVDQAEEAFSLCLEEGERRQFFDALVAHTERGKVVLAIRADYTGELAEHPALAALVERGLFLLGAMSPEGLRAAIEGPARQHGLVLEPGLTDLLVREVEGEPGALPLLSHALRETWLHHEGRTLTVAGYQASGGIRGAVAQSAETLYGNVPDGERADLRELVLRLVVPGPEGEPVRSRIPRGQAVVTPAQGNLIEQMVAARLVTSDEGDVELAHEALVRAWPRLRGWLEDDLEGQRIRYRLTQAAADWEALGRPESELYRGARLVAVREWVAAARPQLAPLEEQFLGAAAELAEAEEASAREQVRREQKVNRRLRALAGGLAVLVVVALVTGVLALRQSRAADRAALGADARRVGTAALTQQDPQGSLMRAIAAARLDESDASLENLHALLASYPQLIRTTDLEVDRTLTRILATPEGLIVLDRAHGIHLVLPESLQALARGQAGTNEGDIAEVPLAYSNREHVLAVASQQPDDLPIRLLDAETLRLGGRQLTGWPARPVGVNSLSVSGNGRYLAAAMTGCGCPSEVKGWIDYAVVKVWDLRTRRLVQSIPLKGPVWLQEVALDKTGRRLFLSGPLRVYAVSTGRRLWELTSHFPVAIAVQRHGGLVAADSPSGGTSSSVEIRKSSDGSLVTSLEGLEHGVTSLQFSHDGSLLAASGYDGLAIVWDVATQQVVDRIDVGGQKVTGITFSPDDRTLYTAAEPGHQVSSWDLTGRRTFLTRVPLQHSVGFQQGNARISHDGTRILRMSQPDRHLEAGIIDVAHDRTTRAQTIPTFSYDAASWAPDDTTFALGYPRGVVALLDGRTGHDLVQRPVLHSLMTELSFSADGRHLLGTDVQGEVVRLDSRTLVRDGPIVRVPEHPYAIASSPDGTYGFVIAGGTRWAPYLSVPNRHFYLVDFDAHRIVRSGPAGVENAVSVDYSPNGKYVTVGGRNGEVAVIDVTTGKPVRPAVVPYSGDSFSVRYNHDGSLVTTASTASQLALLDGETGQVLATAALPPTEGTAISNFAPDGTIVVYTALGHVFRWDPSSVRALDFACSITGRGLSPAEWETVFSGRAWRETCPP